MICPPLVGDKMYRHRCTFCHLDNKMCRVTKRATTLRSVPLWWWTILQYHLLADSRYAHSMPVFLPNKIVNFIIITTTTVIFIQPGANACWDRSPITIPKSKWMKRRWKWALLCRHGTARWGTRPEEMGSWRIHPMCSTAVTNTVPASLSTVSGFIPREKLAFRHLLLSSTPV